MKYIDSEKLTTKIDGIIDGLKRNCTPDPMGWTEECLAAAEIEVLELVKSVIDEMKQEERIGQGDGHDLRGVAGRPPAVEDSRI